MDMFAMPLKSPLSILLVDDDTDHRHFMTRAFHKAGIGKKLQCFATASEAIAFLESQGAKPDVATICLITDIRMPVMDGFELLRYLKTHPDHAVIPAIVLSGSDEAKDIEKAYRLGASSYLRKPVHLSDLDRMVVKLMDYWGMCEVPIPAAG